MAALAAPSDSPGWGLGCPPGCSTAAQATHANFPPGCFAWRPKSGGRHGRGGQGPARTRAGSGAARRRAAVEHIAAHACAAPCRGARRGVPAGAGSAFPRASFAAGSRRLHVRYVRAARRALPHPVPTRASPQLRVTVAWLLSVVLRTSLAGGSRRNCTEERGQRFCKPGTGRGSHGKAG